ncbi:hypothetical protein CCR97_10160 [Rhodoplanes elegans]|uniref:Uncharacterized protein n=1 Tax=Rhodoplanes elegans TaxID=29408 RepID=A0A327KQH9_9BRAD|nr:hypothetical protein [Rhodoplanes elegans]MBK5958569.1 hypothetical protein [Rhodoplanes elegans]RAI40537.1 hypothetical protein CH338_06000 [Rhodoplanes elegans]
MTDASASAVDWNSFEDQVDAVAEYASMLDLLSSHDDLDNRQRRAFRRIAGDLGANGIALRATFDALHRERVARRVGGAEQRPETAEA